jgi:hypothetical protein
MNVVSGELRVKQGKVGGEWLLWYGANGGCDRYLDTVDDSPEQVLRVLASFVRESLLYGASALHAGKSSMGHANAGRQ